MWPLGCRESCETGGTRWMSEDGVRWSTQDSECNCIHMVNITSWSHNIVGSSRVLSISATTTTEIFNATPVTLHACLRRTSKALIIRTVDFFIRSLRRLRCWLERSIESWLWNISFVPSGQNSDQECFSISELVCWSVEFVMIAIRTLIINV